MVDFDPVSAISLVSSSMFRIKGVSFLRNCGAASVGEYNRVLSTELKRKLATVKSLKADVSSVSASSQRLKLETLGGQIYVFNSADDAKLPCFVSLRWFPGSMGFQNGAGMKTEKPLGTKLPFKSTRSKSRILSW